MPPSSVAALSRLSGISGARGASGNQFFDPTGQTFDDLDALNQASELEETRSGLNPTARYELGARHMQDEFDAMDAAQGQRREASRRADAAWLGPDGLARTSPEVAANDRELNLGDERVAHEAANLPTVLRMAREKLLAQGQAASDVYWQPGTQSMRADQAREQERLTRMRYDDPVDVRTQGEITKEQIAAEARKAAAATAAGGQTQSAQIAAQARELAAALQRGDVSVDPATIATLQKALGLGGGTAGAQTPAGGSTPAEGTRGSINGVPGVWHNAGPQGAGWYRE